MKFEWDEDKRQENIRRHGFDFYDAPAMFSAPMLVAPDDRCEYGEERWIGLGMVGGRFAVVVFTERGGERKKTVRIISMRKALKHERESYEREISL
jgi:uncharacterized DUF497 family protein